MRKILSFILRHHVVFLFGLLQMISLWLIANSSMYHESSLLNSSNRVTGSIYSSLDYMNEFFRLREINDSLASEINMVMNRLPMASQSDTSTQQSISDTARFQRYEITWAKVVNSTTQYRNNYLTLNKGSIHGIKSRSAVISNRGIVGIVKDVSPHFSTVISVLNEKFRLSCSIGPLQYTGFLSWEGGDYRYAYLNDVPQHVKVKKGMMVYSSEFSNIFPTGIPVGRIASYELPSGANAYRIKVLLGTDLRQTDYVFVVHDLLKEERENLEQKSKEDQE